MEEKRSSKVFWDSQKYTKLQKPRAFFCTVQVHDSNILVTGKVLVNASVS